MPQRSPKETFLQALAALGSSAGNAKLRNTLGWNEAAYDEIKQALVDDGAIVRGRGRGGSVAVATVRKPASPSKPKKAARSAPTAANVGYEAELWQMADTLRGSMDAAEYKHVALGLIFLKYVSDAFEETHAKLVADLEQGADPEDPDEYSTENVFWVPPEARWSHLKNQARQSTIGQAVDTAMEGLERDNPALKDVLPKEFARPALDKARLGQIIDLISNIKVGDAEARAKDVLGRVYEYFLSQFASAEGRKGGEFYTPNCIVKLLVEMLEPYRGRVYDPCCGSSGMFVQSIEFIRAHATGNGNGGEASADISIYGQESNYTTWRLAKMNLAIRGIDGQIAHGDTFRNDRHPDLRADFILANPPFNISDWGGDLLQGDKRWHFGDPPSRNANFAWLQHIYHHLAPRGTAGVVLANGSMSSAQSGEGDIRYVDLANTKWGSIGKVESYAWLDAPTRARRILRLGDTIVGTVRPGNGSFCYIGVDGLTGSTGFAVLRPIHPRYRAFVWSAATSPENIARLAHLADGGAYPAIRTDAISATQIAVPCNNLLDVFHTFGSDTLALMEANAIESRTLTQIHNRLLPRLMSGDTRVADIAHIT